MPTITSQGALSRHITEFLTTDPRVKQYKCKTIQNPDYYYDGSVFGAVDVAHKLDTSTVQAGSIWLRDKAIVSVGTKKADDAYKIIGLRPDDNQSGSEQFEFSVESIEINGKPQTINLRDRMEVSSITTKFGGNLYVQRARQRCRVMVEATNADEGFKIALRIHTKGLTLTYRADLDEYWFYNEKGEFRFRLGKPYLVDPATMNPLKPDDLGAYPPLVKHSLTEIGKGEYLYAKEPTGAFGKVKLPDRFLIDADTVYSTTADGDIHVSGASNWANAYTGYGCTPQVSSASTDLALELDNRTSNSQWLGRIFSYFVTSGVVGTISACSSYYYDQWGAGFYYCDQKGIQADTLVKEDYNGYSGEEYGHVSFGTTGYHENPWNATGIADIDQAGTTKVCLRNYDNDYLNSEPSPGAYIGTYFYSANKSDTTYDTYLSIVTAAAAATFIKDIMRHHFIPAFIGGN